MTQRKAGRSTLVSDKIILREKKWPETAALFNGKKVNMPQQEDKEVLLVGAPSITAMKYVKTKPDRIERKKNNIIIVVGDFNTFFQLHFKESEQ